MHAAATEMEELADQRQLLGLNEVVEVPTPRRQPQLVLHIILEQPVMTGCEGPAWKRFSFLDVLVDGEHVGMCWLPLKDRDVGEWKRSSPFGINGSWPDMSLHLVAVRMDYCIDRDTGAPVVFRTEEPHTSGHTAVVGTARVPLLGALALWADDDSDDDEEEAARKRSRRVDPEEEAPPNLLEGTRVFSKRVPLMGLRSPAPGDVGGEPGYVVCGKVKVIMWLTAQEALRTWSTS